MKIENRQRVLLIATLALMGLLLADRLVFTPLGRAWTARSERITDLRKQVADGTLLLQREHSLQARWSQMSTNTLPNNPSLAEQQLLRAIDAWAQESRVSISGITPQWKSDQDNYLTLECRVDAAGNLDELSRFLYDAEKGPMAIKLESVELTTRDNAGQELAMGVRLSGLVLTPNGHPE
jgi:Tfp pilus assembly protein PilO